MNGRGSGLLLHITSLPSRYGIGDLGPAAFRFCDLLSSARQKYWQILPLNPTSGGHDHSPYKSTSASACNTLLISPEELMKAGLLDAAAIEHAPDFPAASVDFGGVERYKGELFSAAFENFRAGRGDHAGYGRFCRENGGWLSDFALFTALHRQYGDRPWNLWPADIRCRQPDALAAAQKDLAWQVEREQFLQFVFHGQWQALHAYCRDRNIRIIGDIPIYVDYDSADVWTHPELFCLDASGRPVVVAGVPPDYFSTTGQLWGNPLYRWEAHEKEGYAWWLGRLGRVLSCTDLVRIDHFRGLVAYWEVPAGSENAIGGRWVPAPADRFLTAPRARFPEMPVIAEDLGIITPDVREIMARFNLPGMRVLLFAFTDDPAGNPHAPHNIPRNVLLYPGTHDNAPARGWYDDVSAPAERDRVRLYFGLEGGGREFARALVRHAMTSAADTAILSVQDLLGLGMEARLNTPGTEKGNWRWRLAEGQVSPDVVDYLRDLTTITGRA
ncbi:MAG: 4-alpha-glucanotransferase [Methanomicrobiales archaeon]|nr:4-alpha-glucanotransferase [Methanomicrobiales archaeon]